MVTAMLLLFCVAVLPLQAQLEQAGVRSAQSHENRERLLANIEEARRLHTIDAATGLRLGREALKLALEAGDSLAQLRARQAIGANRWIRGEYELAVQEFMLALELAEALHSPHDEGASLNNLGLVFRTIGMADRAQGYFREAVQIRTRIDDRPGLTRTLMNLGLLFFDAGKIDSAAIIQNRSLRLARELDDTLNIARNLHYLGRIDHAEGRLRQAIEHLEEASRLFLLIGDRNGMALSCATLAELQLKAGRTAHARTSAMRALDEALRLDSPFAIREAAGVLSAVHAALGDYRKAYDYQAIHRAMDDSLRSIEASYQLAQLNVERLIAAREEQWTVREKQRQREWEATRKADALVRNALIAGSLLLVVVVIVLVAAYRGKQRSERFIAAQKERIEETNRELALEIDTRERMLGIIGHDLLGPIGNIAGMLDLAGGGNEVSEEERAELLESARITANGSADLLARLLAWARVQKQELTLTLEDGDIMETVRSVASLMQSRATVKKIELRVGGPPSAPLRYDSYVLTVIIENLLSNALKFTAENGRIDLDIELTEQCCVLRVTDNGVGIDEDKVERIREGRAVASERGSAMEFGHGLGLELCQRLIRLHGGRFDVHSVVGKGSTFRVEIPA